MSDKDAFIRRVLWTTAFANLGAGAMFAFPASAVGQLAGLPASVPPLYRATVGLFVLIFAGAYAWLARQAEIDRPMVGLAAIGKLSFALITFALWAAAAVPGRTALVAGADVVFAVLFLRWLMAPKGSADPGILE